MTSLSSILNADQTFSDNKFWRKQILDLALLGTEKDDVVIFGDPQFFFGVTTNLTDDTEYFCAKIPKYLLKIGPFVHFKSESKFIIGKVYPKQKYHYINTVKSFGYFGAVVPKWIDLEHFYIYHWLNHSKWLNKNKLNINPKGLWFLKPFKNHSMDFISIHIYFHYSENGEVIDSILFDTEY